MAPDKMEYQIRFRADMFERHPVSSDPKKSLFPLLLFNKATMDLNSARRADSSGMFNFFISLILAQI